jgi:hypothetical protein
MKTAITACKRGHPFTEENTYIWPKDGHRRCRLCHRDRFRVSEAKRKARRNAASALAREAARPRVARDDCIWAAGLFEGEGTATITSGGSSRRHTRVVAMLSSTDKEVVEFFQARWAASAVTLHTPKTSPRARPAWTWVLSGWRAGQFFEAILPHVRTTRVRAKIALALLAQSRKKPGVRNDAEYIAEHAGYMARMRVLNHRGTGPLRAGPQVDEVYRTGGMPALLPGADRKALASGA